MIFEHLSENKKTLVAIVVVLLVSGSILYVRQSVWQNKGNGVENQAEVTDNKPFIVRQNDPQSINRLFDRLEELGADRPSLRFITLVNSDSYYYARDDKNVYWVFINPRKIEDADADSFTILNLNGAGVIGRDKSHVFVTGDMVPKANPETFHMVGKVDDGTGTYYADDKIVFYKERVGVQNDYRYRLREVVGADPKTIRVLPIQSGLMAADDTHVYVDGNMVPNIDSKTFVSATSSPYVYDKDNVYFLKVFTARQKPSLNFLSRYGEMRIFTNDLFSGGYVAIGDKMFFGTTTLDGADPETFYIFDAELQLGDNTQTKCIGAGRCPYAKDASSVYYFGKKIIGADATTFTPIGYGLLHNQGKDPGSAQPNYASDDARIYYQGIIVEGADSKTFTPILSGGYAYEYGKDASYVYWRTKHIEYADPKTFEPLAGQQPYEGCGAGRYGTDATGVYYQDKHIEGADLKTFKVIIGAEDYAEDANHFYKEDKPVDRKEFKVCNYG